MRTPSEAGGFDGCFRFADPFLPRYRRVDLRLPDKLDPWSLLDGSFTQTAPIPVSWATLGALDDVLWTTEAVLGLVSDRFVGWLEEQNVTGWRVFSVVPKDRWAGASTYHGLVVTGRSAPIEYWRDSGTAEREDWRIRIRPSKWDGSDFFLAEGTAYIFTTEKVHRIVSGHHIKNVEMKTLADVRVADVVVRNRIRAQ